ncbi:MAG: cytochrome c biogenesis protein CcsA [Terriglobia bacterium]
MSETSYHRLSLALWVVALVLVVWAWYVVFLHVPEERTMGDIQRIFYLHLSSAFVSFLSFFVVFIASIAYLATRRVVWDWVAVSAAEMGIIFVAAVLISGPIWAKPVWGTWWTWDARLTTTLILFLIYLAYLLLRYYTLETTRQATLAAVFAIIGFVDVPIVYMATRWWRTQHPQPVILGGEGSGLEPRMWYGLLVAFAAMLIVGALLFLQRYRLEESRHELDELRRAVGRLE